MKEESSNQKSFEDWLCLCCCSSVISCAQLFVISRTAAWQESLSFNISWSLHLLMFIESMMPSNHLILCHPLASCPQSFPASVFSSESALCIRWPMYWSFRFSNSPSNEYSVLISLRIDWFDLLAVQGNLQGSPPAPQFESINSLVLRLLYDPTLTSVHDYWKRLPVTH